MSKLHSFESNWYAIYTKPRFEKKVYERLVKLDVNSFLPLISTVRQWSDRKKRVQVPLLKSYVFIHCPTTKLKEFYALPGVLTVVKHLGVPAIIQNFEIENLKILMNNSADVNFTPSECLTKGDAIIVEKGPFQNLIAECIKYKGKNRIIVKFNGLANIFEINIPLSYVKKMS